MIPPLPDLRLLHAFGNEGVFLEKAANGGALAARIAVGLMEANRSLDGRRREEHLEAQAERMNAAFREMEAAKMFQLRERMRHSRVPLILMAMQPRGGGGAPGLGMPMQGSPRYLTGEDVPLGMDEGMVRMASAIGADLAHHALEKDAGIGSVMSGLSNVLKGQKNPLAGISKGVSGFLGGSKAPAGGGAGFLQGAKNKLQGALQGFGQGKAKNPFMSPPPAAHNPFGGAQQAAAQTRKTTVQQGRAAGTVQAPAKPATPAQPVGGKVEPAAPVQKSPVEAAQAAAPDTGAAGGEGFDLQKAWQRTGLSDGAWKWKLPTLAAGAAGMYALHAGAKKGLEVLGREPHAAQYNAGGAIPAYGVNQYGVPDRSTPFM